MKSVDHNFYRNLPKEDPLGLVFAIAAIAKSNTVVGVLPRMSVSSYIIAIDSQFHIRRIFWK